MISIIIITLCGIALAIALLFCFINVSHSDNGIVISMSPPNSTGDWIFVAIGTGFLLVICLVFWTALNPCLFD